MTSPKKPRALRPGDGIRIVSLASPVQLDHLQKGCEELVRLGYAPETDRDSVLAHQGFFAGPAENRLAALKEALVESASTRAIFCSRGGYGSSYLLEGLNTTAFANAPKILLGASDITALQIYPLAEIPLGDFLRPHGCIEFRPRRRAPPTATMASASYACRH